MISPWRNPLPLQEYTTQRVVVYFYDGRWVPITVHSFMDAIQLHRQAQRNGHELYIFPNHVSPDGFVNGDESQKSYEFPNYRETLLNQNLKYGDRHSR